MQDLIAAEKYVQPSRELKAEIMYLKGICHAGMGQFAEARAMFRYVVDHFPDSEFGYKAKEELIEQSHAYIDEFRGFLEARPQSGDYDKKIISAIRERWWNACDKSASIATLNRQSKVRLTYRLHADGSVSDLVVESSEVEEPLVDLCRQAILSAAPFDPWPDELRREVGREFRRIALTFFYHPRRTEPRKSISSPVGETVSSTRFDSPPGSTTSSSAQTSEINFPEKL
jgi:hypothetical protein